MLLGSRREQQRDAVPARIRQMDLQMIADLKDFRGSFRSEGFGDESELGNELATVAKIARRGDAAEFQSGTAPVAFGAAQRLGPAMKMPPTARAGVEVDALQHFFLQRGPEALYGREAPGPCGLLELVEARDAELPVDLEGPVGAQPGNVQKIQNPRRNLVTH